MLKQILIFSMGCSVSTTCLHLHAQLCCLVHATRCECTMHAFDTMMLIRTRCNNALISKWVQYAICSEYCWIVLRMCLHDFGSFQVCFSIHKVCNIHLLVVCSVVQVVLVFSFGLKGKVLDMCKPCMVLEHDHDHSMLPLHVSAVLL